MPPGGTAIGWRVPSTARSTRIGLLLRSEGGIWIGIVQSDGSLRESDRSEKHPCRRRRRLINGGCESSAHFFMPSSFLLRIHTSPSVRYSSSVSAPAISAFLDQSRIVSLLVAFSFVTVPVPDLDLITERHASRQDHRSQRGHSWYDLHSYFLARESILAMILTALFSLRIVLGYDPLLSPQFLQTEIPAVSHFFPLHPAFTFAKAKTDEPSINSPTAPLSPFAGVAMRPSRLSSSAMTVCWSWSAPAPSTTPTLLSSTLVA